MTTRSGGKRGDPDMLIAAALERRRSLMTSGVTDACRIVHDEADGLPGVVIERWDRVLVAQLHEGRLGVDPETLRPSIAALQERLGTQAVYVKHFVRDRARVEDAQDARHRDPVPWIGQPVDPEVPIHEHGLRFIVRPYDGFSVGLFLEHRENRRLLREHASGRRVLNAFAYTCGFSVAAAAGGAASVTSVDVSKRYLDWGRRNFAENGIDAAQHLFFCSDTLDFYRRAQRQGRRYDLIILDPPTFSRLRRPARTFVLEDRLEELLAGALALLDPGGLLFFSTNSRTLGRGRIEKALAGAADRRAFRVLDRPALPLDFAGDPDYSRSILARFD